MLRKGQPVPSLDAQIAQWREYIDNGSAISASDADEVEAHLRDQVTELVEAGLADDEAFLIAVRRIGSVDALSREFAREHSARLWKQLVLAGSDDDLERRGGGWAEAIAFAVMAAATIQVGRLISGFPDQEPIWLLRNVSLFVLPFLAAYFARRRGLDAKQWLVAAAPFVAAAVLVNALALDPGSAADLLVAAHLPVALWLCVAYPYMGATLHAHERRMDFIRFTGEWFIYYVLIALGGGVLMLLTGLILGPVSEQLLETLAMWIVPSGAAGAVIIAAWLVESKQRVVENMAPVLTIIFTPLFAAMLVVATVTYAVTGLSAAFDRELLVTFDALLIVVLGLVLYSVSARTPGLPPGVLDYTQLVAVTSALVLNTMVLGSMVARISGLGLTPNRVAALGLNLVLLVSLSVTAWLSLRFVRTRSGFHRIERWQTAYLPVFAIWTGTVAVTFPVVFWLVD